MKAFYESDEALMVYYCYDYFTSIKQQISLLSKEVLHSKLRIRCINIKHGYKLHFRNR